MSNLTELAKRYRAFERVDRSDFQRRARILQSIWRTEHGYPIGEHAGRGSRRPVVAENAHPCGDLSLRMNNCPGRKFRPLRDQLVSPNNPKGLFIQDGRSSDG